MSTIRMSSPRSRVSAGLLMYRRVNGEIEVFLAHPGGPFFAHRDEGVWSIPKGEVDAGEELLDTARREFQEEVGLLPQGPYLELGTIRQKGGKIVHAWAVEGDWPLGRQHCCNTFKMEWPLGSGHFKEFPEIDQVCFFNLAEARKRLKPAQWPLVERLLQLLKGL